MSKSDNIYLEDILDSIKAIEEFTDSIDYKEFKYDRRTSSANVRELEIIGEAVGKLSKKIKDENPEIHWQDIKGLRNFLIHEYFGVDLEIVWKVVNDDIPELKKNSKISFGLKKIKN